MKSSCVGIAAAGVACLSLTFPASGARPKTAPRGMPERMAMTTLADADFRPAPDALPPGAEIAVLRGDPMRGPYAIHLYLPDGYSVAPHWHSDREEVVVLQGILYLSEPDLAPMPLGEGAFASVPARTPHRARCQGKGGCVVTILRNSAFDIHYVNPADDPRRELRD